MLQIREILSFKKNERHSFLGIESWLIEIDCVVLILEVTLSFCTSITTLMLEISEHEERNC